MVFGNVREGDDDFWFNATTEKYEDLVAAGVIDPAKVTPHRPAERAASIAGLMLTTEAMIADVQDEKVKAATRRAAWNGNVIPG